VESIKSNLNEEINHSSQKTPLKKVGAFLKEARQARSISTEELSRQLRIGEEQLIAIESGEEESLPEKVFIKAMIRRISEKLNLDTNFIIEEFKGRSIKKEEQYSPVSIKNKTSSNDYKIFPVMIILSAILGLISSIYFINYLSETRLEKSELSNEYLN
tara:strand:- start:3611 stop:4087 length:477 start_codon:yes stop_codon:yes gene_type:complete